VTIRYDPRDLAEIRVFYRDQFLCRAVCPELSATTVGLKDLVRARNARRRELQGSITERSKLVELLIGVHANEPPPLPPAEEPSPPAQRLKRYHNE
jgi:putative transposase